MIRALRRWWQARRRRARLLNDYLAQADERHPSSRFDRWHRNGPDESLTD